MGLAGRLHGMTTVSEAEPCPCRHFSTGDCVPCRVSRPPVNCPNPHNSRDRTLLVSLANGKLAALDVHTGKRLWTFNSGAPLLSSTNQPASVREVAGAGELSKGVLFRAALRPVASVLHAGTLPSDVFRNG